MLFRIAISITLLSIVNCQLSTVHAQASQELFGRNRVQYKYFDFSSISTRNFEIYYYKGGYQLAQLAANYAEADLKRITDLAGFTPYSKMKLIIYNAVSDLQQSNIGLDMQRYQVGGKTTIVKSKVEIAFPGTQVGFKREISYGIAKILLSEMMYGGSFKDMMQSSYLLSLPEWYLDGCAAYIAEGWSNQMDDFIRDVISSDKTGSNFKKPSHLIGRDAVIAGHSIWNFIAQRYGKENISSILNLTRLTRNEESSIEGTLGQPYYRFIEDWRGYYTSMAEMIVARYDRPEIAFRITKNNRKGLIYNNIRISPDGNFVAYSENYKGKYNVIIYDHKLKKYKNILTGGQQTIDQKVDYELPLLTWQSADILSIIEIKKGKLMLYNYNIHSKHILKSTFRQFTHILGFDYSGDGNKLILSAVKKGQSDIYIYNLRSDKMKQITDDLYDDIDPHFMPASRAIMFSSNRKNDTLGIDKGTFRDITNNFDIFLYDLKKSNDTLYRIPSNTVSANETKPMGLDNENIIYLSDEKGIKNLYRYNLLTRQKQSISSFQQNINEFDIRKGIVEEGNREIEGIKGIEGKGDGKVLPSTREGFRGAVSVVFLITNKGKEYVYYYDDFVSPPLTPSPPLIPPKGGKEKGGRTGQPLTPPSGKRDGKVPPSGGFRGAFDFDHERPVINVSTYRQKIVEEGNREIEEDDVQWTSGQHYGREEIKNESPREISPDPVVQNDTIIKNPKSKKSGDEEIDIDDYRFGTDPDNIVEEGNKEIEEDDVQWTSGQHYGREEIRNESTREIRPDPIVQNDTIIRNPKSKNVLISFPYPYELSVSAHTITSSISIDPLLGLGLVLDVGLTDMLEDHKIYGGILGLTDFRSAKYFAEYHYLKRRVDLSMSYDIQSLHFADFAFISSGKYRLQEVNFMMSYPFTVSKSIRFTPFFVQTRYTDLNTLSSSDFVTNFTGYNSEFVIDNSIVYGLNMVEGTRFKVGFKSYFGLKDQENNFNILKIDLRHYQKIHREITLASRISYGYSFGKASKLFSLGGMDNWWFYPPIAFEPETKNLLVADANELLFLSFATNLRGFNYNARYGNKYVLFNTELRIPVVRYFNKSTISSSFFRNLQLTTFIDAGTAWSGKSPFNSDNNYNKKVVVSKPFKATVINYRNPLISGYGLGIRSMMLGYYMKFDLAWGVEDYQVKNPKLYWTLGYDF